MNVLLYSAPIHSGKTTRLQQWCSRRMDVGGILMPDMDGRRYFQSIRTSLQWPIGEIDPLSSFYSDQTMTAGPYVFSAQAFALAQQELQFSEGISWLVIDEIGKLELKETGFASALRKLMADQEQPDRTLLLVVRDTLLADVVQRFKLQAARIVHSIDEL